MFASTGDEFINQILIAKERKQDSDYLKQAAKVAQSNSYDEKFDELIRGINEKIQVCSDIVPEKLKVIVLYEAKSLKINTIKDHLDSYGQFSFHSITYSSATQDSDIQTDLYHYDVVVIHYSLRLSYEAGYLTLSNKATRLLKSYTGLKVAFIQDEYDTTNIAIGWLKKLGVHLVFTCIPECSTRQVYSEAALPHVRFINNLTGYVPQELIDYPALAITKRQVVIGYRGRSLPYWYGDLGQEKEAIGRMMKAICIERGVKEDIEWDETRRIYGNSWYEFLASSKSTLGTESGSNVFDFTGDLHRNIATFLEKKPGALYQEVFDLFLQPHEGLVKMNQVSPKIFEAICLHTALVLFEGEYSGVLEPNKHYIPLKKDFSNINEVLEKINSDDYLTELTNNAYQDIVMSGKYSYQAFVNLFDSTISSFLKKSRAIEYSYNLAHKKRLLQRSARFVRKLSTYAFFRKIKHVITRKIKIFNPFLYFVQKKLDQLL